MLFREVYETITDDISYETTRYMLTIMNSNLRTLITAAHQITRHGFKRVNKKLISRPVNLVLRSYFIISRGTAVAQWLRCCATNR